VQRACGAAQSRDPIGALRSIRGTRLALM